MNPPPRTRGDCKDGPRPCPWVDCRHHLALDQALAKAGNGQHELSLEHSCALDVADLAEQRGGLTLDEVGTILGVTRMRVLQIETLALTSARRAAMAMGVDLDRVLQVRAEDLRTTLDRWPSGTEPKPEPAPKPEPKPRPPKPRKTKPPPPKPIRIIEAPAVLLCACGCGREVKRKEDGERGFQKIYARPSCGDAVRRRRRA